MEHIIMQERGAKKSYLASYKGQIFWSSCPEEAIVFPSVEAAREFFKEEVSQDSTVSIGAYRWITDEIIKL